MKKNIIANIIGRIWSFISVFVFVPFYLKFLGSEAYGLISFYTVILGLLAFADAGLTATLNREFARADRDQIYKANLLTTIEVIYFFICLAIIIGIWITAPIVVAKWLNIEGISVKDAIYYIRLTGFGVAFQFICSLYQGGLMGLQKQVLANTLQIIWGIFRSAVLLIPLYFFPSLDVFFIWQIGMTIIYFIVLRTSLRNQVTIREKTHFSKKILKNIWRYAAGMMAMAVLSAILIQTDKLVTSKMLSLTEFGYYSLASLISQAPLMIVIPIGLAVLPKLTNLVSTGEQAEMLLLFRKTTLLVISISSIITFALIAYMPEILLLWTHNTELALSVSQVARILCLGSLFQAMQLMPYYLGMANGHTQTNVILGVFSVFFLVPSIIVLINKLGIIGVGIPWLVMSIITFFLLGFLIINRFNSIYFKQWLKTDTFKPFLSILITSIFVFSITYSMPKGWYVIGYCAIIAFLGIICVTYIFNKEFPEEKVLYKIKSFLKF